MVAASELGKGAGAMAKRPRGEPREPGEASGGVQAGLEQADESLRRSGEEVGEQARRAGEGLGAVMQSGAILAGAAQTVSQEWLNYAQAATRRNVEAMTSMARCRTMRELIDAQNDRLIEEMGEFMQSSRRISERVLAAAQDAAGAIGDGARRS